MRYSVEGSNQRQKEEAMFIHLVNYLKDIALSLSNVTHPPFFLLVLPVKHLQVIEILL